MFGERGRWAMVAFGVSIIFNLFLAGVVVGRLTMPGHPFDGPMSEPQGNMGLVLGLFPRGQIRDLPQSERHAFFTALRNHSVDLKTAHARVMNARHAVVAAIAAPVYHRTALSAKLDELRQAMTQQQIAGQNAALDALAVLSPEARTQIAQDADRRMQHGQGSDRGSRRGPPENDDPPPPEQQATVPVAHPVQTAALPTQPATQPSATADTSAKPSPEVRAAMKAMRQTCATDIATFCKDVEQGGGRIAKCLKDHRDDLSTSCKSAWQNVRAARQGESQ